VINSKRELPRFPPPFASAWGDDEFGLWAEFELPHRSDAIRQRMRWIEPGSFWMGSPNTEGGRDEIEGPHHLVTLTRGFWLADTACTQALWGAVMNSNPSLFRGEQLPVENVNWDEVQHFLAALDGVTLGCKPELPTEAEWEYGCRAGTQTPFSFGNFVTRTDAKRDSDFPYWANVGEGNAGRTVQVHRLPANPWGLYEMHGNVFEMCADAPRKYSRDAVVDPVGGMLGENARVLRGGAWHSNRDIARSACRDMSVLRGGDVGFRFCLRPGQSFN
jgi:formylglycine-generating enzyme required for sulfatase activity